MAKRIFKKYVHNKQNTRTRRRVVNEILAEISRFIELSNDEIEIGAYNDIKETIERKYAKELEKVSNNGWELVKWQVTKS